MVQNVNLKRLEKFNYKPSESELNNIYSIGGHKIFPMSSNARSLYRYFTDQKMELTLPYGPHEEEIKPRFSKSKLIKMQMSPNPSDGIINLAYNVLEHCRYEIYSENSQFCSSGVLQSEYKEKTIDLSNAPTGFYMIIVRDNKNDEWLFVKK